MKNAEQSVTNNRKTGRPMRPHQADLGRSVDRALSGLDRAEENVSAGRYSEAMELYERNIGTLIGLLKSIPENNIGGIVDRSVLADRVNVALTDAEAVKQIMSSRGGGDHAMKGGAVVEERPTSRLSSAFSMLGIGKSRSYEDDCRRTRKDYDYAHAISMLTSSPKNQNGQPPDDVATTITQGQPGKEQSSPRRRKR